jgi:hypothetical protein
MAFTPLVQLKSLVKLLSLLSDASIRPEEDRIHRRRQIPPFVP